VASSAAVKRSLMVRSDVRALTIGELERESGVRRRTIYYYVHHGLLPEAQKASPSRALYTEDHLVLLNEIEQMRHEGMRRAAIKMRLEGRIRAAGANGVDLVARREQETRQAILAAATAQEVAAVELNEQAAHLARFNAILNGVAGRVGVYQGSLYDAAPAGPYDLIVSNPPFIPVPDGVPFALCGAGGEDGLTVLLPILEGLPAQLSPQGRAIIYAEGPGDREGPFVRRLLAELVEREGLEAQLMATSALTARSALILRAVSLEKLKRNVPAELAQWKSLYERLGATHLYNYIVRVRRGPAGRLTQIMAFDPHREERGIEVQPGVIVKPK